MSILLFGAGVLGGIVAALPVVLEPDCPNIVKVARSVYAVTDVVLLIAGLNLVTGVRWSAPVGLIAVGLLAFLSFDVVYLLASTDAAWPTGTAWDLGWILFGGAWGAAALLPGMAHLRARDQARVAPAPMRMVLVAGASLLPLGLLLTESVKRTSWYVLLLTGAFAIMLGLVLARLVAVMRELSRQISGERGLREAVTELAAAADLEAVAAAVERVVPTLLPGRNPLRVEMHPAGQPRSDAGTGAAALVGESRRNVDLPAGGRLA